MQVGIDVKFMYTDFGGRDPSGFGDTATLKNSQIFLSTHGPMGPWSLIILIDRNRLKKFMQVGVDMYACTPILVSVTSPVSEIPLPSKMAKFPFRPMGYSPWSSKILIDQNRLKKFMQVGIDVKFMYTNFGGCDLSSFGDTATLKNGQISLSTHGL